VHPSGEKKQFDEHYTEGGDATSEEIHSFGYGRDDVIIEDRFLRGVVEGGRGKKGAGGKKGGWKGPISPGPEATSPAERPE